MDTKNILTSKTVWGAVLAMAPQIVAATQGDPAAITTVVGGLLAIFGRFRAKKALRVKPGSAGVWLMAALALPVSSLFTGCNTPTQTLAAQIAVTLGTERIVRDDPARAAKAVAIATEVERLAAADDATTVDLVIAAVRSRIDFSKLTPGEQLAIDALITAVQEELNRKVSAGALPADFKLRVATVAGWIKAGATPYLPPAPAT